MENIRIYATDEAYNLIANSQDKEKIKKVLSDIYKIASQNKGKCPEFFSEETEFGISTLWAENPSDETIMLVYYMQGKMCYYSYPDYSQFYEALKTAKPIELT